MELLQGIGRAVAVSSSQDANPGPWNACKRTALPHCSPETGAGAGGVLGRIGLRPEQFGPEHGALGAGITGMEPGAVPVAAGITGCAPLVK